MRGKTWTPEDDYICMSKDLSMAEKTELLERTLQSIQTHMSRIRKYGENYKEKWALICKERAEKKGTNDKTRERRYKPWKPTEDDYILSNPTLSDNEIGIELGRSEGSVRTRRWIITRRMLG